MRELASRKDYYLQDEELYSKLLLIDKLFRWALKMIALIMNQG
jgi:hypothetical protein